MSSSFSGAGESRAPSCFSVGIIGCGNMGSALGKGILNNSELCRIHPLHVYDSGTDKSLQLRISAETRGQKLSIAASARALAEDSDLTIIAVKPDQVAEVLGEVRPVFERRPRKVLMSIAAGVSLARLSERLGPEAAVARVMPNTLVTIGRGIFGLCLGAAVQPPEAEALRRLLRGLGTLVELPESKMNAFTALAGSGPAYVFHFIESLAEAGVSVGLNREDSLRIAVELAHGGALLAESSKLHPAILREQVSSPAGTTIAAINHLDRAGTRGHLIDAVLKANARGREMEEEK